MSGTGSTRGDVTLSSLMMSHSGAGRVSTLFVMTALGLGWFSPSTSLLSSFAPHQEFLLVVCAGVV